MQPTAEGHQHQDPSLQSPLGNMEQENHQIELLQPSRVGIVGQEPKSTRKKVKLI